MPGRFPLFTDENIDGPLIQALRQQGWDLVRAIEVYAQGRACGHRRPSQPVVIGSLNNPNDPPPPLPRQ